MRRFFIVLLAAVLLPRAVAAQMAFDPDEGCLNVVDIAYDHSLGQFGGHGFSGQYMHERFIGEQFSIGAGVGFSRLNDPGISAVPVFVSAHYFFLDRRFSPFVNMRAGAYWSSRVNPVTSRRMGLNLYVAPAAGVKFHITPDVGVFAALSYDGFLARIFDITGDYHNRMFSNLGANIGICFQIPGW